MTSVTKRPSYQQAMDGVRDLLGFLGEDPGREGLRDTPGRVVRAFMELTSGYLEDPAALLDRDFALADNGDSLGSYDQLVLSRCIPFVSTCEHHLMMFVGEAHVAYLPGGDRVVGLSKLARVVDGYARRLQVQERLTQQIADALQAKLNPLGVAVIVAAKHTCQCYRGVRKDGDMVTSAMMGNFRDDARARAELLELIKL